MKIITLIENLVYGEKLMAEHGLSIYIETRSNKILFDTGQSGKFADNAEFLGVDISKVDSLVLSHGHFDHTGGLYEFLKINNKAKIYIKEEAFIEKYRNNKKDYIGIPFSKSLFLDRVCCVDGKTEIDDEIFIIPDIKIFNKNDLNYGNLLVRKEFGFEMDTFQDEQFLSIIKDDSMSIISGCSHNGITNIIETAKDIFKLPVNLILGGFHLEKSDDKKVEEVLNYFDKNSFNTMGVSHCTGIEKYGQLKRRYEDKVFYNFTGKSIEI